MPGADREYEKSRKVFVGGLDYETTDNSLKDYFEQFGELTDWVVMKFPDTKRSRGFGFVTFKDPENLEDCFNAAPHHVDGASVEIKRATPREEDRGRGGRGGSGRGRDDDGEELDPEDRLMRKLFIGGLNYSTTDSDMREYFEQFGQLEDCVVMKFNDSGRSRGFGFVTFATSSQLDDCQAQRPHSLAGRTLETKRATPRKESGKAEAQMSVKKLFVGGLSDEMTDDDLRDYFGQYGNIMNVEQLKWNDTGKKRGFGFVEFDDYDPVDKVVLVGKHVLMNRRLEIKKALSKQEMNMMKKNDSVDVWGGDNRRDMRGGDRDFGRGDNRRGGGGSSRGDDRDYRGGGGGGNMGGGFGNNMGSMMMGNMSNMMNNMNMAMMSQMMNSGPMMNMMRNMGGGGGGNFGGGNERGGGYGADGGGFDEDDMGGSKGYSTGMGGRGGGMGGGGMGNMSNNMMNQMAMMQNMMMNMQQQQGGAGSRSGGGGPMRGAGAGQSMRDNSAPYSRRSIDRSGSGGGYGGGNSGGYGGGSGSFGGNGGGMKRW